jgi:hypothetical protein
MIWPTKNPRVGCGSSLLVWECACIWGEMCVAVGSDTLAQVLYLACCRLVSNDVSFSFLWDTVFVPTQVFLEGVVQQQQLL